MTTELSALVQLIEEVSGNVVPDRDAFRLGAIAEARARAVSAADIKTYIQMLRRDQDGEEWRRLLSLITVNESYLFRSPQQFKCLVELALPELLAKRGTSRQFRVWSAGCARGEEASTLAIVFAECPLLAGWDWRIMATDVDQEALADARRGVYGQRAVAKVPEAYMERYFESRGEDFELVSRLRDRIEYKELNLVREPLGMPEKTFDVIFFRNVLIYFRPSSQQRVAEAVARTMVEDGYLFLGSSESLWHVYPDLVPVDLGSCFCYRWIDEAADEPAGKAGPAAEAAEADEYDHALTESNYQLTPMMARTVRETTSQQKPVHQPAEPAVAKPAPIASRKTARAAIVQALKDQDIELGREMIRDATRIFPEDAIIRALDGLTYDLSDEVDRAIRAYRAALYLDPWLYQVRYLLAQSMERIGWKERATHEFAAVLAMMSSPESRELPGHAELGLPGRSQVRSSCLERAARGT